MYTFASLHNLATAELALAVIRTRAALTYFALCGGVIVMSIDT